jgi:elongation factor Tu
MKWPWKRERTADGTTSKDVDVLLAEANAASPTGPFRMVVEDVFTIKNRGTVATGRIGSGVVKVGQQVRILRAGTVLSTTTITAVEMFRKKLDSAAAGDNVGLLLDRATGDNVMRDDVLES